MRRLVRLYCGFRSWPLVYDLMEPLRAVIDGLTVQFYLDKFEKIAPDNLVRDYAHHIGINLREFRIKHKRYSLKMLDAIDFYIRSYAVGCENQCIEELWVPEVTAIDFLRKAETDHEKSSS